MFCDRAVTLYRVIIHRYHRRPLQAEAMIILGVLAVSQYVWRGIGRYLVLRPLVQSAFLSGKISSLALLI